MTLGITLDKFVDAEFVRRNYQPTSQCSDGEIIDIFSVQDWNRSIEELGFVPRPNAVFSPDLYVALNPDIEGNNPVNHFISHGSADKRN